MICLNGLFLRDCQVKGYGVENYDYQQDDVSVIVCT